ncbi:GNAT family N-acetyltransferase [Promicromonospora alba]|uniref:GNAT family N-acetyltransferase n=1 Tax=Promicromonospora alba TaxID=1616110 RepID=A0ABV9HLU3_9MICO
MCAYIGGPRPRDELERAIPEVPRQRAGGSVVDLDGAAIGIVQLERRDAGYEILPAVGKVELGFLFLPEAWGKGYAAEACAAALYWFADAVPGEAAVLATQTDNKPSVRLAMKLRFTEVERLEAYGGAAVRRTARSGDGHHRWPVVQVGGRKPATPTRCFRRQSHLPPARRPIHDPNDAIGHGSQETGVQSRKELTSVPQ